MDKLINLDYVLDKTQAKVINPQVLAFIGDKMGIQLYMAAIFAFGTRLFANFATIRRLLIKKYSKDTKSKNEDKVLREDNVI